MSRTAAFSLAGLCVLTAACTAFDKAMGRPPRTTHEEKLAARGEPVRLLPHVALAAKARGLEVDAEKQQVSVTAGELTDLDFTPDEGALALEVTR